jgi:hypothetical protein
MRREKMDREMFDKWVERMNDGWCEEGCYKGLVVVNDVLLLIDMREGMNVRKYDLSKVDWLEVEEKYVEDGGDEEYESIMNWMGLMRVMRKYLIG